MNMDALSWMDSMAAPIWYALTALMVLAIVLVARAEGRFLQAKTYWVLGLIALVVLFPRYTDMQVVPMLIANLVLLVATGYVMSRLSESSRVAGHLLGPQLVWLGLGAGYMTLRFLAR